MLGIPPGPSPLPASLHGRIREELRREIATGSLKPHDRLPSESALMARFGVSRITVRQAVGALQAEGLVFTLHGKGSFVSAPKAEHHLARLLGLAEIMAAAGHEVFNDVVGFAEKPAGAEVAGRLRVRRGAPVTEIRRVRHLDRSPVSYEVTWLPAALGAQLAGADLARRDIFAILENDCGRRLGRADLTIEATGADSEVAGHLGLARKAPVLRIERLTLDANGTPVDFEHLHYRGDALRYSLTVERAPAGGRAGRLRDLAP